MEGSDQNQQQQQQLRAQQRDTLGGRIMLTAIAALFAAIIIVIFLHIYVRWHIRRARRRRVAILLTSGDPSPPTRSAPRGLDLGLIQSLPITTRSASGGPIDCAVCLSEVEEGEKVRILPKCGHGFHVECIDTWFFHHSTCPLCRAGVEAVAGPETPPRAAIMPTACDSCGASSSSGGMVGIEEPPRRIEEFGLGFGFGAAGGRIVTLKRLLSRDRRLYTGRVLDSDADLETGEGASPHPAAPPALARRETEVGLDGRTRLN